MSPDEAYDWEFGSLENRVSWWCASCEEERNLSEDATPECPVCHLYPLEAL